MIEIKDKKDCCGCWACANACAKHCITMKEDGEGFRYPVVDETKCIDCGLCEAVCPILNPQKREEKAQTAYVVQHRDEQILRESTSGGAFTAIATWMIKQGGVVFGATFGEDNEVHHVAVENIKDLQMFRNSKYVQSLIGETYTEARKWLKEGRIVCFSGTPCQIEGLLKFLRKPYDNLVTVDVVCRAVPSPLVLRKYREMQEERLSQEVAGMKFRDKWYGYKYSSLTLADSAGATFYHEGIDTDVYLRAFFSGMSFRPSCSNCRFRPKNRLSDFTIWDCFDVDKFSKELDNDKGVTRMLVHTDKGRHILMKCSQWLNIVDVPVEKAVAGVKELVESPIVNSKRDDFFKALNEQPAAEVFSTFFPVTLRHHIEKQARLLSNRLGIYKQMKLLFKLLHGNGEIRR